MWKYINSSIFRLLVIPVSLIIALTVSSISYFMPKQIENNVEESAIASAEQTVKQFKEIRKYYTQNIVKKALSNGSLKPSYKHNEMDNGIPLPATFIHDMSAALEKEDTSINLYSAYPFPNRKERKMDDFQQKAWNYLKKNPNSKYVRLQEVNGDPILRVAIADKMVAKACVDCHNSRADTPKTGWKLNDVRGVLEVSTNISAQTERGESLTQLVVIAFAGAALVILVLLSLIAKSLSVPTQRITNTMHQLQSGDLDSVVSDQHLSHEIGKIARATEKFRIALIDKRSSDELAEQEKRLRLKAE